MKFIIISLLIICSKLISAQETIVYDTLFYNSDSEKKFELIKSSGVIVNGLKIGLWKSYYDNRKLKEEGEYALLLKKDIKIVNHQDCDECIINEKEIRDKLNESYSIETGKWVSYYKNGQIMQTGSYLPTWKIDIEWAEIIGDNNSIEYFSSGIPINPQAMQTGVWMYYDEDGKLVEKTNYIDGKEIYNTTNDK